MEDLLRSLKAIAEPSRMRLLALCAQSELTVSELVQILGQSQPRVSRHLKLLCDAGLLQRLREGSWIFYRFDRKRDIGAIGSHILSVIPENDPTFLLDLKRLEEVKTNRRKVAADYFERNAATWDKIRSLYVEEAKVEAAIQKQLNTTQIIRFVDIGTGTGRMLELISEHITSGEGVDQSHEMLSIARDNLDKAKIGNCQVRQGDMYQLPFSDNYCDAACIHQVLHFADEPIRVIAEATRILRPGGKLVIVDFAPHELEDLRKTYLHRRLGFSDGELVHMFQRNGLKFQAPVHLTGGQLTVGIWTGVKVENENNNDE